MSDIAIRVEGLSKEYRIGERVRGYKTFREVLTNAFTAPFRRRNSGAKTAEKDNRFLALNNVNFNIRQGEIVGVIGQNGAGKSTLLKILSRITEPSTGFAEVHGRVGSLLEVGTGFHPELTGRENIYLNGAILGMRSTEIGEKMDAIESFSGVEKFADTPVKYYSSGMYLRLAFAVAAHLEPEILLVDEVLAVGDAAFQKKCIGKMGDIAAGGRTVLFVSHNLGAVRELCKTIVVLKNGAVSFQGPVAEGLAHYSRIITEPDEEGQTKGRTGWRSFAIGGRTEYESTVFERDEPITLEGRLETIEAIQGSIIGILYDAIGSIVVHERMEIGELPGNYLEPGVYDLRLDFPTIWLAPGIYTALLKFAGHHYDGTYERHATERIVFEISGSSRGLAGASLSPACRWNLEPVNIPTGPELQITSEVRQSTF